MSLPEIIGRFNRAKRNPGFMGEAEKREVFEYLTRPGIKEDSLEQRVDAAEIGIKVITEAEEGSVELYDSIVSILSEEITNREPDSITRRMMHLRAKANLFAFEYDEEDRRLLDAVRDKFGVILLRLEKARDTGPVKQALTLLKEMPNLTGDIQTTRTAYQIAMTTFRELPQDIQKVYISKFADMCSTLYRKTDAFYFAIRAMELWREKARYESTEPAAKRLYRTAQRIERLLRTPGMKPDQRRELMVIEQDCLRNADPTYLDGGAFRYISARLQALDRSLS